MGRHSDLPFLPLAVCLLPSASHASPRHGVGPMSEELLRAENLAKTFRSGDETLVVFSSAVVLLPHPDEHPPVK